MHQNKKECLRDFLEKTVACIGNNNIQYYTNCLTRLRIEIKEDIETLKKKNIDLTTSPFRIIAKGNEIQIMLGPKLAIESKKIMDDILDKRNIVDKK